MAAYCTTADVYRWIPPGSVQNPARLASVSPATDVLSMAEHGLATDDKITFRAEAGGSLPSPLVAGTTYYAIPLTDSTFSVAATPAGAAIDITTAGVNVVVISSLPWDAWIADASAEIDDQLPAHAVPLAAPYPAVIVSYCGGLVAEKALAFAGVIDGSLDKRLMRVRADVDLWRKGKTLRDQTGQSATNLAVRSTIKGADPRGWAAASGGNGVIP